jgi:predicted RecB family nuclease
MTITPFLFEAFLKCPTKCWLRFTGEPPSGNAYAEWVQIKNESYRADAAKRLIANAPADECAPSSRSSRRKEAHYSAESLKTARWCVATDVPVQSLMLTAPKSGSSRGNEAQTSSPEMSQSLLTSAATIETCPHAVERIPSEGRGKSAQFIPIHFIFRNKLTKDDKLLLAFDVFVFSEMLGRTVSLGKIIHGDDHATLKVRTLALAGEVRKHIGKITTLLASPTPPDLVLNRHCAECEFQARCRKIAIEKDDLNLLASMSAKERQKLRSKGIFTVTQLSYTFRPRRRPKRLRDKREKYHHSLKALAIREKKIHIVGSPELKIEGTPVYLDVEGLPDCGFYYLIGLRIGHGESAVQHSLWADTVADEAKIWREFLGILETVEKPVLIHYGSYETTFLKAMKERHGGLLDDSVAAKAIGSAINLVSVMFARIYFPTFSNGLKEIARYLGFTWTNAESSGLNSVTWRRDWEELRDGTAKIKLLNYNAQDCEALRLLTDRVGQLSGQLTAESPAEAGRADVVQADAKEFQRKSKWRAFTSPVSGFEKINAAAHWDYQRFRVYARSGNAPKKASPPRPKKLRPEQAQLVVVWAALRQCPKCQRKAHSKGTRKSRTVHDIVFGRHSLKMRMVKHVFSTYRSEAATKCKERFQRNRDKLFTFLSHGGVPWHNNNAEHAIKAFARLRDVIAGASTEKGREEYLTLLSVCQTCKYMGVDFLDFLRSGEKDIHAFAESRCRRKRPSQTNPPTSLPTDAME